VRGYLKPISTLRRPLQSVDFATVNRFEPRMSALTFASSGCGSRRRGHGRTHSGRCALEKFGGDSMGETLRNFPRVPPATGKLLMDNYR